MNKGKSRKEAVLWVVVAIAIIAFIGRYAYSEFSGKFAQDRAKVARIKQQQESWQKIKVDKNCRVTGTDFTAEKQEWYHQAISRKERK